MRVRRGTNPIAWLDPTGNRLYKSRMLAVIQSLINLQERDRQMLRLETEIANMAMERGALEEKAKVAQMGLDAAKLASKQAESERKRLELEGATKQEQVNKYRTQQGLTKKNDEYQALTKQIKAALEEIRSLEDQQIVWMEKLEQLEKGVAEAAKQTKEAIARLDQARKQIDERESKLKATLADLKVNHAELVAAVDETALTKYQRIRKMKGSNAVVGIEHAACGGCHMRLPTQIQVSCRAQQEIVFCPSCGRMLYYTRDMDLTPAGD